MFLLSIFSYWSTINFQQGDDEGVEKHIGKYAKGCQKNENNSNNEGIKKDVKDVKKKNWMIGNHGITIRVSIRMLKNNGYTRKR